MRSRKNGKSNATGATTADAKRCRKSGARERLRLRDVAAAQGCCSPRANYRACGLLASHQKLEDVRWAAHSSASRRRPDRADSRNGAACARKSSPSARDHRREPIRGIGAEDGGATEELLGAIRALVAREDAGEEIALAGGLFANVRLTADSPRRCRWMEGYLPREGDDGLSVAPGIAFRMRSDRHADVARASPSARKSNQAGFRQDVSTRDDRCGRPAPPRGDAGRKRRRLIAPE